MFLLLLLLCSLTQTFTYAIIFTDQNVNFLQDVRFYLYTRANNKSAEELRVDDVIALEESNYDSSKATNFMTHGWLNTYQGWNCITIRKAFLTSDDCNVIIVDWGNIASLKYLESASRIKAIGAYVAKMIRFLVSQGSDPNNMSLVGHSLGAHLMGLAGYQATDKVARVVGLDPAGPEFWSAGPGEGISTNDAQIVEVIFTNKGNLALSIPVGHVNLYPNGGGPRQPGCSSDANKYCDHDRAYIYYAEMLTRPSSWYAIRCKSYSVFLNDTCNEDDVFAAFQWTARGNEKDNYYLRTADKAPFGLGFNGTRPACAFQDSCSRYV